MGRRKKGDKVDGWINFYKPYDMGSTEAVNKIRRALNAQKAGHAGTLDPLATGILPIALGEATKTIPFIQDRAKTYVFTVQWGTQTTTDDEEGDVINSSDTKVSLGDVETLLPQFIGEIEQTPPQFSAVKINGERAYDLAREGKAVDIKTRCVFIEELKIIKHDDDAQTTQLETLCGKGTYIRSIARDMGNILGCFGHIKSLERTKVGPFTTENAILLDKITEISDNPDPKAMLLPLESALDDIPAISLTQEQATQLKHGQSVSFITRSDISSLEQQGLYPSKQETIALATLNGKPLGLVSFKGVEAKPSRLFNL